MKKENPAAGPLEASRDDRCRRDEGSVDVDRTAVPLSDVGRPRPRAVRRRCAGGRKRQRRHDEPLARPSQRRSRTGSGEGGRQAKRIFVRVAGEWAFGA